MTEREILEQTYDKTCKIFELQKTKDSNGISGKQWVEVHADEVINCAVSVNKKASPAQSEVNSLSSLYTVFMTDLIPVKKGSKIICDGMELMSGRPHVYKGSHQEIPVELQERA